MVLGFPNAVVGALAFVLGAAVGSFLNVVIWRLPRGQSLSNPPRSYCPHCQRTLTALENIPLLSFIALRARCRTCGEPISWRYFWVELLTAGMFLAIFWRFGATADTVAYCLFVSALIVAFFIDLERYLIPDEVNTFALLVGIGRDLWGIVHYEPGHALLLGWLPRSLVGAVICAALFVFIQILGLVLFRKDAMGDGDVKLARAIGAMLPISQALVSFLLAIGAGAVLGSALILWGSLRSKRTENPETEPVDKDEEELTLAAALGQTLRFGTLYVTFLDLLLPLAKRLRAPGAARAVESLGLGYPETIEEDDFVAGPTHIPFGPYMVLGVLLALFVGTALIEWYKVWAHLN